MPTVMLNYTPVAIKITNFQSKWTERKFPCLPSSVNSSSLPDREGREMQRELESDRDKGRQESEEETLDILLCGPHCWSCWCSGEVPAPCLTWTHDYKPKNIAMHVSNQYHQPLHDQHCYGSCTHHYHSHHHPFCHQNALPLLSETEWAFTMIDDGTTTNSHIHSIIIKITMIITSVIITLHTWNLEVMPDFFPACINFWRKLNHANYRVKLL